MGFFEETLAPIPFPRIVKVKQTFPTDYIEDVEGYIAAQMNNVKGYRDIKPGMSIAITAGSRGISSMQPTIRQIVRSLKEKGAKPFVIPAMGSHGGATAEGQIEVLANLGITEETVGAPIRSTMDVVLIGTALNGRPVYIDRYAHEADGIVVVNRIKAHTSFRGKYESGLMKMMAIGLGKQKGAQHYHQTGMNIFDQIVESVGLEVIKNANVVFGVGIVDNSFAQPVEIEVIDSRDIPEREAALLLKANDLLAKMFCNQLDVLAIKSVGKNFSGTGMDTNVTGRYYNERIISKDMQATRVALLDLTDESHGNATGMGLADVITKRLFDKVILEQTYPNALTSTATSAVKIPMIMKNDKMTIAACIKTCMILDHAQARLAIIENTKNMKYFYISENMIEEAKSKSHVEIIGDPFEIPFSEDGTLVLDFPH